MKKWIAFFSLMLLIVGSSMVMTSCSDDNNEGEEIVITPQTLPDAAKQFLEKYYPGIEITQAQVENYGGIMTYEVTLANDHEIVFNAEGEWQEVYAVPGGSIPSGIVPEAIQQYLDENYNGFGVNEINRTGYGYNVELTTGLDLMFNPLGQCIGIGSD